MVDKEIRNVCNEEIKDGKKYKSTNKEALNTTEQSTPTSILGCITNPIRGVESTLPENILELYHSYGFDCLKPFNLCVMDQEVVIFSSGNIIHLYNARTGQMQFRRSTSGGGIGHITCNPVLAHLAVGERGSRPPLLVYEWPSFNMVCELMGGTERSYSHLDYSPDGELLLSQGGNPDYTLTVWDWRKSAILVRGRAHNQDVINACFSGFVPGHLITAGAGHIKFWKMTETFTGLKLQGFSGRFSKTEVCDIIGFLAMADEKVVSGSQWGNMLLWEEGLIKVEVCRRGRQPCHNAPITQIMFNGGELTTIGLDGMVKLWYFETINQANPPEDDRFIELEPMFEFEIGSPQDPVAIMSMVKMVNRIENFFWYVQDGNGGLWLVDLNVNHANKAPERLLACHSGPVVGMAPSPHGTHLASLGQDGRLFLHDYSQKITVASRKFLTCGSHLVWLEHESVNILVAGFSDGVLRVLVALFKGPLHANQERIVVTQVTRPHTVAITVLSPAPGGALLVSGSEDRTLFLYQILTSSQRVELCPVGYIHVPSPAVSIHWRINQTVTMLVGCRSGHLVEIALTDTSPSADPATYLLGGVTKVHHQLHGKGRNPGTCYSDMIDVPEENQVTTQQPSTSSADVPEENQVTTQQPSTSSTDVPEENQVTTQQPSTSSMDSPIESQVEEHPSSLCTGNKSPVLFAVYVESDDVLVSMGGVDAGYLYHYQPSNMELAVASTVSPGTAIHCHAYNLNRKYLVLGLEDGTIRVTKVNCDDYWSLSMHDSAVHELCFSYDNRHLFSCGKDGSVFCYLFNPPEEDRPVILATTVDKEEDRPVILTTTVDKEEDRPVILTTTVDKEEDRPVILATTVDKEEDRPVILATTVDKEEDRPVILATRVDKEQLSKIEEADSSVEYSLEQSRQRAELNRKNRLSEKKKQMVREKIQELAKDYQEIMKRNHKLKASQVIPSHEFRLDPRIDTDLEESIRSKMEIMEKEMAFSLEKSKLALSKLRKYTLDHLDSRMVHVLACRNGGVKVTTFHQRKLTPEFYRTQEIVRQKLQQEELKSQEMELKERSISLGELQKLISQPWSKEPRLSKFKVPVVVEKKLTLLEVLVKGLAVNTHEFKTNAKLRRLLERYQSRKIRTETRQAEWDELWSRKPYEGTNCPDDEAAIMEAESSVGDYKLRTMPDYRVPPELCVSSAYKYQQVLQARETIFQTKTQFNQKVLTLREKKVALVARLQEQVARLQDIHRQIPPYLTKTIDKLPAIDKALEFPEELYKLHEEESALPPSRCETAEAEECCWLSGGALTESQLVHQVSIELMREDDAPTNWERELTLITTNRRLYEQDELLREMRASTEQFDEQVRQLAGEKIKVEVDVKFLELHLLRLDQELNVIKSGWEEGIAETVQQRTLERHGMQTKILRLKGRLNTLKRELDCLVDQERDILVTFQDSVGDNKFSDFLWRLYKKKHRPVRTSDSEDSEEEPTSSDSVSETDDRSGSHEWRDSISGRFDESVCPEGCDQQLYEKTLQLRGNRHTLEQEMQEIQKSMEVLWKELELALKKIKVTEEGLKAAQAKLDDFKREKLRRLNEVECVVLVGLEQIQHSARGVAGAVVFSRPELSRLQARPGELDRETEQQRATLRQNQRHMHHLNTDCRHMAAQIVQLNKQAAEVMERKFGSQVSVSELEETVLRQQVAEMKSSVGDVQRHGQLRLKKLQEKLCQKQAHLSRLVQENTEKLNLLAILEDEKRQLDKILRTQAYKLEHPVQDREAQYRRDIERLTHIVQSQAQQKETLNKEIRQLSLKSRPPRLPPITDKTEDIDREREREEERQAAENLRQMFQDMVHQDKSPRMLDDIRGALHNMACKTDHRCMTAEHTNRTVHYYTDDEHADKTVHYYMDTEHTNKIVHYNMDAEHADATVHYNTDVYHGDKTAHYTDAGQTDNTAHYTNAGQTDNTAHYSDAGQTDNTEHSTDMDPTRMEHYSSNLEHVSDPQTLKNIISKINSLNEAVVKDSKENQQVLHRVLHLLEELRGLVDEEELSEIIGELETIKTHAENSKLVQQAIESSVAKLTRFLA